MDFLHVRKGLADIPSNAKREFRPQMGVTYRRPPPILTAMTPPVNWNALLASILETFHCQTGTIHQAADGGRILTLVCQIGVPESLMEKISSIPFGKGIAGAAAESREPVELCNLQQDLGGVAKPDARQTGVSGSLAVPIFAKESGQVIGTLGIGKFAPYEFTAAEKLRLAEHAAHIGGLFEHKDA
jgi:signal transduction protein with GAF and PtsI domain